MCGIAGIFYINNKRTIDRGVLDEMTDLLSHRGPDDRGTFIDRNLGLGYRRLSIIDLSPAGHQPMFNENNTVCIVCNGEIYNFPELRAELEGKGHRFRSLTDTEVILHAYEEYGTDCLERIDGMFAFAIWDSQKRSLFLARDRFGIKPLHYFYKNGIFVFGSEIKSILAVSEVPRNMDPYGLWDYFSLMHIPTPGTIFKDIRKFLPAQAMAVKENAPVREWQYWDIDTAEGAQRTEAEWAEELEALFENSIRRHLVADVPVGCFLSGGVDSSAIVAFAAKIKKEPIKTYSMSFIHDGAEFDESPMQKLVSEKFKTDHHEIRVEPDILDTVDLLIKEFDEPFAVPSAIGLYHIAKLASQSVKVVLSGDGGDELFAGYATRYERDRLFYLSNSLPLRVKKIFKSMVQGIPVAFDRVSPLRNIRKSLEHASINDQERYVRLLSIYSMENKMAVFNKDFINGLGINDEITSEYYKNAWRHPALTRLSGRLNYDIKTSLMDEMLTKMDRCTSMVSIEGRVPFLDKKFAECALKIPQSLKYARNNGKKIFKKILKGLVPDDILMAKKRGFTVPINKWLLDDKSDVEYNSKIFNNDFIRKMKRRYQAGDRRFGYHFWLLKCFSVWEAMQDRSIV